MDEAAQNLRRLVRRDWLLTMVALLCGPALAALLVYLPGSFSAATFDVRVWTEESRAVAVLIWLGLTFPCTLLTLILEDEIGKIRDKRETLRQEYLQQARDAANRPNIRSSRERSGRRLEL